jgi:hypothetical protein
MWNYLATTMRPDGFGILNNDADLENTRRGILNVASTYNRPDWTWIATNGKEGVKPTSGPSFVLPWAGQLISRSGFDEDAQYSFFDIGPWGSGHQHNDKLNLTITAYGRDLIVDGGRFAYRGEVANKFRKYATGSQSHNVILVDGKGQADGQKVATVPLSENLVAITKDFDYGSGTFDKYVGLEGTFSQTRSVVYIRGRFWVVADQLKTDRPRKIEALWHWHPSNQVNIQKSGITTTNNDRGNLMIIPVNVTDWKVDLVKGQETPTIQGWYSKVYNTFEPNPTTVYSRQLKADDTFVWVLWPSEGKTPNIHTEILSKNAYSVKVRVWDNQKMHWDIMVPFADSSKTEVKFVSKEDK